MSLAELTKRINVEHEEQEWWWCRVETDLALFWRWDEVERKGRVLAKQLHDTGEAGRFRQQWEELQLEQIIWRGWVEIMGLECRGDLWKWYQAGRRYHQTFGYL